LHVRVEFVVSVPNSLVDPEQLRKSSKPTTVITATITPTITVLTSIMSFVI